jgi:hypothetical protein
VPRGPALVAVGSAATCSWRQEATRMKR